MSKELKEQLADFWSRFIDPFGMEEKKIQQFSTGDGMLGWWEVAIRRRQSIPGEGLGTASGSILARPVLKKTVYLALGKETFTFAWLD